MSEPSTTPADAEAGRTRVAVANRSAGSVVAAAAFAVFWGWLLFRWINDLLGAPFVPRGESVVPPEAVAGLGAGLPVLGGVFDAAAFAVEYLPALASGLWLTVVLTVVSILLGFPFAVLLSVTRVYGRVSKYLSLAYTELFRGTPLLAQLFVLYYGLDLSGAIPGLLEGVFANRAVWVAMLGFVLNCAAYQAEYIRSALISVDEGQLTAGRSVGLSKVGTIRYVVLPQGLRYAIPGWTNELVYLIKYTSLAAFITVPELFNQAQTIASENFRYTAVFVLTALLYLGLVLSATRLMSAVEDRVAIPGLGSDVEGR